jgi:hypothetical protein
MEDAVKASRPEVGSSRRRTRGSVRIWTAMVTLRQLVG